MKQDTQIRTKEMREKLKTTVQNEIDRLPEQLESLEPKDRVQVLFKLMPYIFPKVDTVHFTEGEPLSFD